MHRRYALPGTLVCRRGPSSDALTFDHDRYGEIVEVSPRGLTLHWEDGQVGVLLWGVADEDGCTPECLAVVSLPA